MIESTLDGVLSPGSATEPGPAPAGAPPARTLLDAFDATLRHHGDRIALSAPDGALTYAGLANAADSLADRLRRLGIGPGGRAGVRVPSGTAELYVAILGVLRAGAAYVPIDADDPPDRAAEILRAAGAGAVVEEGLAVRDLRPAGDPVGREVVPEPDGLVAGKDGGPGAREDGRAVAAGDRAADPADDAWIIFTSGSTGAPKGVAVTHRAAAAFVDAESALWTISPADRVLAGLSVSFDASCEEIWLAWAHGATLVPAPRALVRSGGELGPWLVANRVSVISTVPTLAAMWEDDSLNGVRLLILGGEACPEQLAWRLAREREVWNTYGPTEATVVSTACRLRGQEPVTIGWPLRGWEVAVLGEDGCPVPVGETGELVIGGVGLGRYLDPDLDRRRFAGIPALGWERAYRTGDMVRETIDGFEFAGRRDHQVKLGGRRVELGEIEAALTGVAGVRAACAVVRETASGNRLLVGYVVGDVDSAGVRAKLGRRLPDGLVPLVAVLDELPMGGSGKVDRAALPWPPPPGSMSRSASEARPGAGAAAAEAGSGAVAGEAGSGAVAADGSFVPPGETPWSETARWLADRWTDQLGPVPIDPASDFFALGGTSLAVAKLVSALRVRYPAVAVADVYQYRRLGALSHRLERLGAVGDSAPLERSTRPRRWGLLQLVGVLGLRVAATPPWLLGVLAVNRLDGGQIGPEVGWGWLALGWLGFVSIPGRALLLALARRLLLGGVEPGRFPRHSWLAFRIWLLERLAATWRLEGLEGTPWAARYARLCGHRVGAGARLFTLPPAASLVTIDAEATVEAGVDLEGWWIEGQELVIGAPRIGQGARIGTQSVLMPGSDIQAGAEVEPGSVIAATVPAGQRWAGSPARQVGRAGEGWPAAAAPRLARRRWWTIMYGLGLTTKNLLPLAAAAPGGLILYLLVGRSTTQTLAGAAIMIAPLIVISFLLGYGLLVALMVRAVSPLIRPGWHAEGGATRWALWLTESLLSEANGVLFPLYLSVYTRLWLRLVGIRVGKRAEVSVTTGLNRLTRLGETTFVADFAVFAPARSRGGWLNVAPIDVGSGSFVGNCAIVAGGTELGERCLVGLLSTAPQQAPDGTSWFGSPPLELPARTEVIDPARTTDPSRRLIVARGATELVRILMPASLSVVLGTLVFDELEQIGAHFGVLAMATAAPIVFLAAGLVAAGLTVALKWLLIGRYRPGQHPLWSFFVWRDEIMNTAQEQLAGAWLMGSAQATPLMSAYLRAMGAKVGRDVRCETMTITEFDMVELADGCVVNRRGLVETHLFHDRLLRIGPAKLGDGATLGPISAMLPDSAVGDGSSVGARSVVMRGEQLPARARWHGAPLVAA